MTREIDDELWAAIGDPTRRRVLDLLLTGGPGTASGLSRSLPVTRQAVAKHLTVLERAGLFARGRDALWPPCRLEAGRLKEVADWVGHYRRFWEESFDRLDEYLKEVQAKQRRRDREGK
jgi:DNA-binding transcriptional ArsR family regulator